MRHGRVIVHHELLIDLKSCKNVHWGRLLHAEGVETWADSDIYVQNALISMYCKFENMVDARWLFNNILNPTVVSWNTLLLGYVENGEADIALDLFARMKTLELKPTSFTYVAMLKACTALAMNADKGRMEVCLQRGREVHSEVGCQMNNYVQGMLVNMYAKCGSIVDAQAIFDSVQKPNLVCWTSLLMGYTENGKGQAALEIFCRMKKAGISPDSVTYIVALKACMSLLVNEDRNARKGCLERVRKIHSEIGRHMSNNLQNTLIDLYCKCGSMEEAGNVFDAIYQPGLVAWTALLSGYVENGDGLAALNLLRRMRALSGCAPDSVTYVSALKACSLVGALSIGRKFHSEIAEYDSHVVTTLVDFYAKCGSMPEAHEVFEFYSKSRNVTTWTALLAGYSKFGDCDYVFDLFEAMQDEGIRPDVVTFVCLLLCCSHAGLVDKARHYFEAMPAQYRIAPTLPHYNCMVDILGRANQLDDAIEMIRKMPCNPDKITWTALLSACGKWKNVELGREAFQALVDMDKHDASSYVLMADIYRSKGMWREQDMILQAKSRRLAGKANVIYENQG